ncbi:E3 ubiquitin-protein ligase sina-like [Anoplophora glabripennis]|uniref:E3 ubiquitin-protein ligase sina-like n=1 Tax=Anoplophora glabripennis TaxID=217634 RepID=UPI00087418BA|nr:E3 ubiquitin-protein ligase sina-like [Anoplophora glabripennis]
MSELLYYPCHNSDYGCKENLRLNEMDDHLTVCSFRIYKCKVSGCSWRGRRTGIEDHFLNSHREAVIIGPENWSRWKNLGSTIYLMSAHKEIFYVHTNTVKNYIYWVVQYIGKSEDTIQYYFQIDIFSDQFQNRKIIICENCQDDIKDDITEIIDSGYAVGIPIAVLETYRNENKEVWYNISIKKT